MRCGRVGYGCGSKSMLSCKSSRASLKDSKLRWASHARRRADAGAGARDAENFVMCRRRSRACSHTFKCRIQENV